MNTVACGIPCAICVQGAILRSRALAGLAFRLAPYVPHPDNLDWVEIIVNQESLDYEGTMILDYLMPRWMI